MILLAIWFCLFAATGILVGGVLSLVVMLAATYAEPSPDDLKEQAEQEKRAKDIGGLIQHSSQNLKDAIQSTMLSEEGSDTNR